MNVETLREAIREFLKFRISESEISFTTQEIQQEGSYRRIRISYTGEEGDEIPAFLLVPDREGPFGAILLHHQHHGQRHFGKSEVCGLVGDSLQAFGPALAKQGILVLAPDSICFEDRRRNRKGTSADEQADIDQHYDEMCYRLLRGDTLMRKVLSDSARAISLLYSLPFVRSDRIGLFGHSYGGNTVLFHGALDTRIDFACASGAACTYDFKMRNQIGIEMAEVIPGFSSHYDIPDLVTCFAPRPLLIVSATDDMASYDADSIVSTAQRTCREMGIDEHVEHKRYQGGHAMTQERFDDIVHWLVMQATRTSI